MNNTARNHISHNLMQRAGALLLIGALTMTACGSNGKNTNNNGSNISSGPTNTPAAPSDAVVISMLYSSEKQAWIEDVTAQFNSEQHKTSDGKPIFIQTEATGSGDSMNLILNGQRQPAVWSPASSIYPSLANDGWLQKGNTSPLIDTSNPATCKNVVVSPVVVMMWKREAQALGWPNKPIGWADIAALSTTPNGWADPPYNLPALGKFRFGHTHPDYSNSGFETILAMAYAAAKPDRVLSVADVQKPETAAFINKVESAVAHYGSSTGFFGTAMIQRGPSYLSAAVVYESVVVSSYNADGSSKNPNDSLVAIYPSEGTFLSDHPACLVNGPWVTTQQKAAAQIYRDYLLTQSAQQKALQYGFRPADPTISIGAPIDAAHGVDPKQPQTVLRVPDAATIRAVRDLWQRQKRQVNLMMVMDVSGSMSDPSGVAGDTTSKINGAIQGAQNFIDQLDDTATVSLIIFDDRIRTVFDTTQVGTNRANLKQQISLLTPGGGTALYDAAAFAVFCMAGDPRASTSTFTEIESSPKCAKPSADQAKRINAVVLMTDGMDNNSVVYHSVDDLMKVIGRNSESTSDVSIFTIGYGADADVNVLGAIAQGAGGEYEPARSSQTISTVYLDLSTFF